MTDSFFVNWQDPDSRRWHPVAKLTRGHGWYTFAYTGGAERASTFQPFANMSDLGSIYISSELFPIFANRVMNERRPEYARYARWSGLEGKRLTDPLLLMARMGGSRATDTLQVHPVPAQRRGQYRMVFFCHGISHLASNTQARAFSFEAGERLFAMLDVQNPFDHDAVALRSSDPAMMVGYCPRFLAKDIRQLASDPKNRLEIRVKQVNLDAPAQYRLLCEAVAYWPEGFLPCDDADHRTIRPFDHNEIVRAVERQINKEEDRLADIRDASAT
ncbi:MAG: HIRAN domain-containing protein [Rhizobiaceae bacterium]|nr:HIRAN domain-containing protein [Rhizobiaceae bacterium]